MRGLCHALYINAHLLNMRYTHLVKAGSLFSRKITNDFTKVITVYHHVYTVCMYHNVCSWWLLHSRLGKDQVLFTKKPPKNKNCKSVLGRKILYIIQNKSDAILVLPFTVLISTPFCSGTLRAHCSLHWHSGLTARCRILKCFHGTLGWHRHNNTD